MSSDRPLPDSGLAENVSADRSSPVAAPPRRELVALAVVLGAGVLYLFAALRFPLWSDGRPASGLFPLAVAGVVILCAGMSIVQHRRGAGPRNDAAIDDDDDGGGEREFGDAFWRVPALVGILAGYVVLVEWFGHLVTSAVLVWLALVIVGGRAWWQQVGLAVLFAGASFALFDLVLGVPLPSWGF